MNVYLKYLFVTICFIGSIYVSNAQVLKKSVHKGNNKEIVLVNTFSGSNTICQGDTTFLTSQYSHCTWHTKDTFIVTLDTLTGMVYGFSGGNATIFCFLGNTELGEFSITVNPLPKVGKIVAVDSFCQSAYITVTDTPLGGTWSVTNNFAQFIGSELYGVLNGIDTILYSVTNSCGTVTAKKPIKILPEPSAGTIWGTNVCKGASATVISSSLGGVWSASNTNVSITETGLVTGIALGTDTISYTVTNWCGVQSSIFVISIDTILQVPPVVGPDRVCVGIADTLKDSIVGGTWQILNGHATITSIDSGGRIIGTVAGIDTVIYTAENSCGQVSILFNIMVDTFPVTGSIISKNYVCEKGALFYSDTVAKTMGTRTWLLTDTNAKVYPDLIRGLIAGLDTIVLIITNGCGSATTTKPITILPLPDGGTIFGVDTLCLGEQATFYDIGANCKGYWNKGVMSIDSLSTFITTTQIGLNIISYTVKNTCGTKTSTKNFEVLIIPNYLEAFGSPNICIGSEIIFRNTTNGGFWYSKTGNAMVDSEKGIVKGMQLGKDTIIYMVKNRCGADSIAIPVTVNPNPTAPVINQIGNLLKVDTLYNAYQWLLDGEYIPDATFNTYTVSTKGVYQVIVSNKYGCSIKSTFKEIDSLKPCNISDLHIYPNPVSTKIYFSWCDIVNVNLLTIEGKSLLVKENVHYLDISQFPAGCYLLYVTNDKGENISTELINKVSE